MTGAESAENPATPGEHGREHDDERVRGTETIDVVEPAVEREDVDATGRVGAVAYPYLVYQASVSIPRRFGGDRETEYVVSLDCSRRMALRADQRPETETRTVEDVLVLPAEIDETQAHEMARRSAFDWTLRTVSLSSSPEIELGEPVAAYKLFWLASRPDGDVVVDSVRGTERPLAE
ncbi:hypothetical protein [Halobacterium zhouii]|uniref:hypothetical protein n=1 Tax=Halobacterium zhouii TaxID=2902624 RepID=UPI001E4B89C7|nr:hypothetical protein [Halobacterium zhouii]